MRSAILSVISDAQAQGEPVNGYQVIQQITERSGDGWRPSPGSVYPTISQLEDEGLIETDTTQGRKSLKLTPAGEEYVTEHADELDAVWQPFEQRDNAASPDDLADLRVEVTQVMNAVWQIVSTGSESQRQAALIPLVETRRKLYGILADGPEQSADEPEQATDEGPEQTTVDPEPPTRAE